MKQLHTNENISLKDNVPTICSRHCKLSHIVVFAIKQADKVDAQLHTLLIKVEPQVRRVDYYHLDICLV